MVPIKFHWHVVVTQNRRSRRCVPCSPPPRARACYPAAAASAGSSGWAATGATGGARSATNGSRQSARQSAWSKLCSSAWSASCRACGGHSGGHSGCHSGCHSGGALSVRDGKAAASSTAHSAAQRQGSEAPLP